MNVSARCPWKCWRTWLSCWRIGDLGGENQRLIRNSTCPNAAIMSGPSTIVHTAQIGRNGTGFAATLAASEPNMSAIFWSIAEATSLSMPVEARFVVVDAAMVLYSWSANSHRSIPKTPKSREHPTRKVVYDCGGGRIRQAPCCSRPWHTHCCVAAQAGVGPHEMATRATLGCALPAAMKAAGQGARCVPREEGRVRSQQQHSSAG